MKSHAKLNFLKPCMGSERIRVWFGVQTCISGARCTQSPSGNNLHVILAKAKIVTKV